MEHYPNVQVNQGHFTNVNIFRPSYQIRLLILRNCVLTTQLSEYFILGFWGETFQLGGKRELEKVMGAPGKGC